MSDEIANAILENAQGPQQATGDNHSVTQHALTSQIEADRYLRSLGGVTDSPTRGIRLNKIRPPGAV